MLKHREIANWLNPARKGFKGDPFYIVPCPPSLVLPLGAEAAEDGAASIDLRLGTWFLSMHQTRTPLLEISEPSELSRRLRTAAGALGLDESARDVLKKHLIFHIRDGRLARSYHVRFGEDFILHPRSFVLGVTLEWLRLPSSLGGYVTGRSSWGRRGLVIATAMGVHPGFTGCLTLELANLGDVPISIRPGMTIGQLFLHKVDINGKDKSVDQSGFSCKRAPQLGRPQPDEIARKLANASL